MKHFLYLTVFLLVAFFTSSNIVTATSTDDSTQVNLNVAGCNDNSICEPINGEDTLTCPNDCVVITPTGGGGHSPGPLQFVYSVVVEPGISSASINFKTQSPVFATISWGETVEYKSGIIHSTVFVTDHTTVLSGLQPKNQYFFLIQYQDRDGRVITSYSGAFSTLSFPEQRLVPNPSIFRALNSQKGVVLSWTNPVDPYFDYVRIMRSSDRFRTDPLVGTLIYEGRSGVIVDKNVENSKRYYYTIFTHENTGAYSSGSGVSTLFSFLENTPITLPPPPVQSPEFLPHFIVVQQGRIVSPVGNIRDIIGKDSISIESTANIPKGFVDLWAEVTIPSKNETRAYLFKYDSQKNIYKTSVPALFSNGDYEVRIYGFNQDHTVLISEGILHVPTPIPNTKIEHTDWTIVTKFFWILAFLMLLIWLKGKF